ncbi:MAG: hypothetical protein ABIH37_05075 [archaeon]
MGKDRKHIKKQNIKKIKAFEKVIEEHEDKIENEEPQSEFTKPYWKKEIGLRKKDKDKSKKYLEGY